MYRIMLDTGDDVFVIEDSYRTQWQADLDAYNEMMSGLAEGETIFVEQYEPEEG